MTVGNTQGDSAWAWLDLGSAINTTDHPVVTVQFDTYRHNPVTSGNTLHNLFWTWTDASDNALVDFGSPDTSADDTYATTTWGVSWDVDKQTYPFGFYGYNEYHAETVLDDYATITLQWDTVNSKASAWYDGSAILLNTTIGESLAGLLRGWDITLNHGSSTGSGTDTVWIDNFKIMGSDIYSTDFEDFTIGNINGQHGWKANAPVPEPSTMILMGTGVVGLIRLRRKKKS